MMTWKNFAARTGAATTTWNYDTNRGFLVSKVYDDGNGTTNTYTPAGRLRTRTWARGVTTTYHTNAAGETVSITYSDGTAAVTNHLDRLGRRTNVIDGAGSRFLSYDAAGRLLLETNASGVLSNFSLAYAYDALGRRTNVSAFDGANLLSASSYAYDSASRLTNVSDGTYSGGYSYLANSPLVSQITFRSNSTTRMTTAKQYDYLNRLQSISSQPGASGLAPIAFSYLYNDANQRIRRTDPDASAWAYDYDSLGQLTSGKRQWQDHTPVAGQQFEYAFDDIGNRTSTKAGGDSGGAALRAAAYSANSLNQYTSRDVPPYAEVQGIAHAGASVTVNSQAAYRKGEYFRAELNPDNSASAVWLAVTNIASLTGTNQTNTGSLFLPKNAEAFAYDADGNTTNDGRFSYCWDAENRMTLAESHASAPTGSKRKVAFEYDGGGRLARRVEYDGSSGSYVLASDTKFVRDGWQLAAEINGTNGQRLRSYLWGLDLSGSLTGAGGVGGLLAMNSAASGAHFYPYDGNGNVVGLVSGVDGTRTASLEYDPFGQTLRRTGPAAAENPFRFSTKRTDDALDLVGYEYRSYNPAVGRWLNRDPIEEKGGQHLHGFLRNEPVSHIDVNGLRCCLCVTVTVGPPASSFSNTPPTPDPTLPPPATHRVYFGIQVPYTITVLGDPNACTCRYVDSGSITGTVGGSPVVPWDDPVSYIPCVSGIDQPGARFSTIVPGTTDYSLDYNWTGTLTCYGSEPFLVPASASASITGHYEGTLTW
jgi:RHS repeat-associated protein